MVQFSSISEMVNHIMLDPDPNILDSPSVFFPEMTLNKKSEESSIGIQGYPVPPNATPPARKSGLIKGLLKAHGRS